MIKKNYIFWNITELNNWRYIVDDQWKTICDSGILDYIENIYITFLGGDINFANYIVNRNNKIILKNYSNDLHNYERLCLNSLLDWSKINCGNVLYIHTKGVSRPHNEYVWGWRKLMEHCLITEFSNCLEKLKENYDAIGNILINDGIISQKISNENHCFHFSGNFWWSHTNYIKNLIQIPENIKLNNDNQFWLCERWILQKYPDVKIHELYNDGSKHYYDHYPKKIIKISSGNWQNNILPEYRII